MSLTVCDITLSTVFFCPGLPTCVVSNACQHTMILFISRLIYWGVVFYYWGGVG
ncbi:hypothetical protein SB30_120226 [Klebsiella quasipneumoniae subsp. similipneumoniae]|nr:hypothetical protein SB30_120226 [Klebsiella quasipneumoniae subsp. similipneumoniae]